MEKSKITKLEKHSFEGWVPRKYLQEFLGIKNTAMSEFPIRYNITISRIGNRVFYSLNDVKKLLEENAISTR